MNRGLPIPFMESLPAEYRADPDAATVALAGKMDSIVGDALESVLDLRRLGRADQCPAALLPELAYELSAGLSPDDGDRTRRKKIVGAIQTHKNRGTWIYDAKIRVDAVALGDSVLYTSWATSGGWLLRSGDASEGTSYMASMGVDGVDPLLGILLIGAFDEWEIPGNIYVDVDNAALTAAQVAKLVLELSADVCPAYMRMYLGYLSAGEFIVYAGGIVN